MSFQNGCAGLGSKVHNTLLMCQDSLCMLQCHGALSQNNCHNGFSVWCLVSKFYINN